MLGSSHGIVPSFRHSTSFWMGPRERLGLKETLRVLPLTWVADSYLDHGTLLDVYCQRYPAGSVVTTSPRYKCTHQGGKWHWLWRSNWDDRNSCSEEHLRGKKVPYKGELYISLGLKLHPSVSWISLHFQLCFQAIKLIQHVLVTSAIKPTKPTHQHPAFNLQPSTFNLQPSTPTTTLILSPHSPWAAKWPPKHSTASKRAPNPIPA